MGRGHDYGALKLNCNVGNTTGWPGFFWTAQDAHYDGLFHYITGYPVIKNKQQWADDGLVDSVTATRIFTTADAENGHSGAALMDNRNSGEPWCTGWCVFGILNTEHASVNGAVRITEGVTNLLLDWADDPK